MEQEAFSFENESSADLKSIKEELDFKSTLLDSARDSIFVLDQKGKILWLNKAAYKTRGYTKEGLLGKPIFKLDAPKYKFLDKRKMTELLETGKIRFESVHRKNDGNSIDVEVNARLIELGKEKMFVSIVRDITDQKEAKKLSDALNNINASIHSTMNFDRIMERVVSKSAKAMGAETAGIGIREEGFWVTKYAYGLPKEVIGQRLRESEAKASMMTVETGQPLVIDDAYNDKRVNIDLMKQHKIRSLLMVPLYTKEESIGGLSFNYHSRVNIFTKNQIDFVKKLGATISLAVQNSKLYHAQRNIADILQGALLTMPQEINGIDFGHLYHSATETARVGGDFYDLFELEHQRIGFVAGDVSGKGIEAATLTSLIKSAIKAHSYYEKSPASTIAKTNALVMKELSDFNFVTLFYAVLDRKAKQIVYCNAGHPSPILITKEPQIKLLETARLPIGVSEEPQYYDEKHAFSEGDTLVLYTDGVTECRFEDELFGEQRLMEFVDKLKNPQAKDIPFLIFNKIMTFTEQKLSDDVALLAISLK